MKRAAYILLLVLASCSKPDGTDGELIAIRADIRQMENNSKGTKAVADPYRGSTPTEENPLKAAVWFSVDPASFIHSPADGTNLPCHTEMTFVSNAMTYADYIPAGSQTPVSLKYPTTDNTPVYCVGFHPSTGWDKPDGGTEGVNVTHVIDGTEDLMFADVIQGTWDEHFNESQQYSHLLTWVKLTACAMTMETAEQWGKVTDVQVTSDKSTVDIDLSKNTGKISYGGSPVKIQGNVPAEGVELSLTSKEIGSVFCIPKVKDGKVVVTVDIKTSKYETKTLDVTLMDLNYNPLTSVDQAIGGLFILSLYFSPFNLIEGTCTLNYWNDQNEDLYLTPTAQ